MRVFAISDIHADYDENMSWVRSLGGESLEDDVLILAGDISDDPSCLEIVFKLLAKSFSRVFYVPGNHELWVHRCRTKTSFEKFKLVQEIAGSCGIYTRPCQLGTLSIVPLSSWYDYSFGQPGDDLKSRWMDFRMCVWPDSFDLGAINQCFLERNEASLSIRNEVVISFSHFLPRIDLMPNYIPESMRYIYPVLGSVKLGAQLDKLKPNIHVYGHSHVNRNVLLNGIRYINNAFAYPSETHIARKKLVCIYERHT